MIVFWLLILGSVVVLPVTALLVLRWAIRQGEFDDLQRTALSIFDETEPLGQVTAHYPVPTRADPRDPPANSIPHDSPDAGAPSHLPS